MNQAGPEASFCKFLLFRKVFFWFLFDKSGWWVTTQQGHRHHIFVGVCWQKRATITIHSMIIGPLNAKFAYLNKEGKVNYAGA